MTTVAEGDCEGDAHDETLPELLTDGDDDPEAVYVAPTVKTVAVGDTDSEALADTLLDLEPETEDELLDE